MTWSTFVVWLMFVQGSNMRLSKVATWMRNSFMDTFGTQLFAYRYEGSYFIDNSIVERFIRPLAGERKKFLLFGSDKMARVSAGYHTAILTCKMQGTSVLEYFKIFFG